ncbi:uncharacterized protein si:dkey-29h14.10 [Sardina pilchardus]|uniref:uncharacterized protein si:dkey-29h14.10 n=1 Tax=Sardina pilchardus TaxID=27697 RepID=UPI002E145914
MDLTLNAPSGFVPPEKQLRGQLFTLSQSLAPCLVEKMTTYLFHTRTITNHEVGVITSQPTPTQKASQLIQIVLRKGRHACLQFYQCLAHCNPDLSEKLTGFTVATPSKTIDKQPSRNYLSTVKSEDYTEQSTSQCCSSPERKFTPHAPAYIINIHNSNLTHCVFGNQSSQIISTEQEHLVAERQDYSLQDTVRSIPISGQQGAAEISGEPHHIQVQHAHMEYVIIGNENSMVVTATQAEEDGEEDDSEEYLESSDG